MGKRHKRKNNKTESTYSDLYSDMDGTFAFIAGFTFCGAPYGVTWEQVGIDPELPFDEKEQLYMKQMDGTAETIEIDAEDELPFD